jgi:CrcB protein
MMRLLLIGIGGFVGAIARYLLSGAVQAVATESAFPYGTLTVNVLGCLGVGVLAELSEMRGVPGSDARAFLVVGLLGGFTTFSAFASETVHAMRDGVFAAAAANVLANVALCVLAVWAGRVLAQLIWR